MKNKYFAIISLGLALTLISCGIGDMGLDSIYFYGERYSEFVMSDLEGYELEELENKEKKERLFGQILSRAEIDSNKFYYYAFYHDYSVNAYTILRVDHKKPCKREMYWFTSKDLNVLDWKIVGYDNCPEQGQDYGDYSDTVFGDIKVYTYKLLDGQLVEDYIIEECKISTEGTFECTAKNLQPTTVLRDTLYFKTKPEKKRGWRKKLPSGTKVYSLGEYKTDTIETRMYEYVKVRLESSKEGWLERKYVAENANAAAILRNTSVHSSPDGPKSGNRLSKYDVVAILDRNETKEWYKVAYIPFGKRDKVEGWIKADVFSYYPLDVAYSHAKLANFSPDSLNAPKYEMVNPVLKESAP